LAVTDTSIGNRALSKLGAQRVLSLGDEGRNARALVAAYAAVRDAELRKHVWSFAAARTTLEADAEPPAFGFARRFPLPGDCLRVLEVGGGEGPLQARDFRERPEPPYAIEGNAILSDASAPLALRYVRRVEDASAFDPLFVEAFACALAAEVAEELTQSDAKKAFVANQYLRAVRDAVRLNAVEKPSEGIADDAWVLARR
jgi:hypothetical protein